MPTREERASVVARIEWLESMGFRRGQGGVPEPVSGASPPWWDDLDRAEQRAILDEQVDWEGFTEAEKEEVEQRVLDEEDAEFWMDGIAADPPDRSDRRPVRPLTRHLIECCELDAWPSEATSMDFGLDSSSHLGAIQYAVREGLVTAEELDAAMGNGDRLTEIARRGENPYRFVEFRTVWDDMRIDPDPEMSTKAEMETLIRERADDAAQRPLHEKGVRYHDEFNRMLDEYADRIPARGQDKEIER